jgi:hypothetical protein
MGLLGKLRLKTCCRIRYAMAGHIRSQTYILLSHSAGSACTTYYHAVPTAYFLGYVAQGIEALQSWMQPGEKKVEKLVHPQVEKWE